MTALVTRLSSMFVGVAEPVFCWLFCVFFILYFYYLPEDREIIAFQVMENIAYYLPLICLENYIYKRVNDNNFDRIIVD